MSVTREELLLLEDCLDDRIGLWEAVWMEPDEPVEQRAALVTGLVGRGLLDVLRVKEWSEARAAPPMSFDAALAVVGNVESYVAPSEGSTAHFYILAITAAGEAEQASCYS